MTTNRPKQSFALKLIFSFCILLIFIGGIEITLQILDLDMQKKNKFFPKNNDIEFPEVYKRDSELFWRFRTDQVIDSKSFSNITYSINSDGMRGDELPKTKEGLRILALGNSCTFGWGVQKQYIWETVLEKRLQTEFPNKNIKVFNGGVPGYSSFQGMKYFQNELLEKVKPDILLIMFGWNDQWTAGISITDAKQQMPNELILGLQNFFSKMKFYQLFKKIILTMVEKNDTDENSYQEGIKRVPLSDFKNNLQSIIRTAKEHNIIPILMVPPAASVDNYFNGQKSKFHHIHLQYQNRIINTSKYENIVCINHQPNFDLYSDLFDNAGADPIHFNIKGQIIFSKPIEELLIQVIDSL